MIPEKSPADPRPDLLPARNTDPTAPLPGPRPFRRGPRPAPEPTGWRILVVDDEESVRRLARITLERAGYEVVCASCGREGLDELDRRAGTGTEPDAVLLDLTMPDCDGAEVLCRIRERWPDLPVVLSSGWFVDRTEPQDPGDAALAYLGKPYGPRDLVAALEASLRTAA